MPLNIALRQVFESSKDQWRRWMERNAGMFQSRTPAGWQLRQNRQDAQQLLFQKSLMQRWPGRIPHNFRILRHHFTSASRSSTLQHDLFQFLMSASTVWPWVMGREVETDSGITGQLCTNLSRQAVLAPVAWANFSSFHRAPLLSVLATIIHRLSTVYLIVSRHVCSPSHSFGGQADLG